MTTTMESYEKASTEMPVGTKNVIFEYVFRRYVSEEYYIFFMGANSSFSNHLMPYIEKTYYKPGTLANDDFQVLLAGDGSSKNREIRSKIVIAKKSRMRSKALKVILQDAIGAPRNVLVSIDPEKAKGLVLMSNGEEKEKSVRCRIIKEFFQIFRYKRSSRGMDTRSRVESEVTQDIG